MLKAYFSQVFARKDVNIVVHLRRFGEERLVKG
jgi:hypothetical protein